MELRFKPRTHSLNLCVVPKYLLPGPLGSPCPYRFKQNDSYPYAAFGVVGVSLTSENVPGLSVSPKHLLLQLPSLPNFSSPVSFRFLHLLSSLPCFTLGWALPTALHFCQSTSWCRFSVADFPNQWAPVRKGGDRTVPATWKGSIEHHC